MVRHPHTVVALKPENSALSRKFRRFLRWMRDNGFHYSDCLSFELGGSGSVADIGVKAVADMEVGDLIATIPKQSCLTILTTEASSMLEEAGIGGGLGLTVALMYERSLQERSKWYSYLQLLPRAQRLPFLWTVEEIDDLLAGTELHQVIKEDRVLMEEDWKESIAPLSELHPGEFPREWFTLDCYLAAKTLVNSRAFEVDEYHGYGMVPLADLFNHKTADEDVHFTNVSSDSETDAEEIQIEEPPHAPPALKNGRKRDNYAYAEKDQEEKCRNVRKSTKKKKKKVSRDGHSDVDELQSEVVIKHEESVRTLPTGRVKSKHLEQYQFLKAELVRTHISNETEMVKDEAFTIKISEKPKSRRKFKAKEYSVEDVISEDEPKSDVKDERQTQRIRKGKGRHRKEDEVQGSTKPQHVAQRKGKQTQLEKETNPESELYQRDWRGGAEIPVNGVDKETHQIKQQGKGRSRRKQRQIEESHTQLSQKVEESSDMASQSRSAILEMILVKNVSGGSEVFNTYGTLSNAALLHRYGFTELNNPFDIVNIDLSLVVQIFGEAYTSRHVRRRLTTWKNVCYSPFDSQDSEYFEISATGKPEEGLLMLIYIVHLSDEDFDALTRIPDSSDSGKKIESIARYLGWGGPPEDPPASMKNRRKSKPHKKDVGKEKELKVDLETWLLTVPACKSLLEVLRVRNDLYPTASIEADEALLSEADSSEQTDKFHALRLRISERSILKKCETNVMRQLDVLKESI